MTNVPSNIFYLPSNAEPPELIPPPARWAVFRARVTRRWWRLRIAAAEIRAILRRSRRDVATEWSGLPSIPDLMERPRRSRGPARILDFESARLRLRGASQP